MVKQSFPSVAVLVALVVVGSCDLQASTFQINWANRNFSGFDSTERGVVDAAIEIWESYFDHNATPGNLFTVQISEASIDGSGNILGRASNMNSHPTSGSPLSGVIQIDSADDGIFFDDPTPLLNEEFVPGFNNTTFNAPGGSPAFGRQDLLTVVLHELGHVLGVSGIFSRWSQFDAASIGLHLLDGRSHTDPHFHPLDFMTPGRPASGRSLPSDIVIQGLDLAFDYRRTGTLDIRNWVTDELTGTWNTIGNWSPTGTPNAAWTVVLENDDPTGNQTSTISQTAFVNSVEIGGLGGTMNVELLPFTQLYTPTVEVNTFGILSGFGIVEGNVVNNGGVLNPGTFVSPAALGSGSGGQVPEPSGLLLISALSGALLAVRKCVCLGPRTRLFS